MLQPGTAHHFSRGAPVPTVIGYPCSGVDSVFLGDTTVVTTENCFWLLPSSDIKACSLPSRLWTEGWMCEGAICIPTAYRYLVGEEQWHTPDTSAYGHVEVLRFARGADVPPWMTDVEPIVPGTFKRPTFERDCYGVTMPWGLLLLPIKGWGPGFIDATGHTGHARIVGPTSHVMWVLSASIKGWDSDDDGETGPLDPVPPRMPELVD